MKIWNDILASFTALTRLPFWRIKELPAEHYEHVTDHWSMVGWLTAGVTAGTLYVTAQVLPMVVAVLLAFIVRILLTGALHEDGLLDLIDGFGGGTSRERILAIMKDSQTGAYATIGFVLYAMLWVGLLATVPLEWAVKGILIGDPLSKFVVSNMPLVLPYARTAETSKMGVVYLSRRPIGKWLLSALFGLLPILIWSQGGGWQMGLVMLGISVVTFVLLIRMMKRKIGGYTGDCIGGTFLICEVISFIGIHLVINI